MPVHARLYFSRFGNKVSRNANVFYVAVCYIARKEYTVCA